MVMSMDAAADQPVGSPIDEATNTANIRHQESADEEPNEDEQSRASGQTVVSKQAPPQQQQEETSQQVSSSIGHTQQQHHHHQQQVRSSSIEMQISRKSSIETERGLPGRQDSWRQRPGVQDALVAQMRDIVEGGQRNQRRQPKSSSDDSLNNQAEGASRASAESGQQKRTRQARQHRCGHPHQHQHQHQHQHHHQRRPSLDTASGPQASHAHHHHRHLAHHQHAHHHHRHHHHHHHHNHNHHQHHRQQQQDAERPGANKRTSSSQRPVVGELAEAQPAETSSVGSKQQTGELKSSNSSVSSYQQQQQRQQQGAEQESDELGQATAAGQENQPRASGERCSQQQLQAHHHHHCHGHHHGHHHHHRRSHKRRLVLGQEQAGSQDPATTTAMARVDTEATSPDSAQERRALSELPAANSGAISTSAACCPYHEHHCPAQARHLALHKAHHAHHAHQHHAHHHQHHQHQHQHQQQKAGVEQQQQPQQQSHRGHHHHRHHHHHHHHHAKQRHRAKHRTATGADEQVKRQANSGEQGEAVPGLEESATTMKTITAATTTTTITTSSVGERTLSQHNDESDTGVVRMHLDQEDDGEAIAKMVQATDRAPVEVVVGDSCADREVVKMEMSPSSEPKPSHRQLDALLVDDLERLVDSTVSDSNLVTSIEVVDTTQRPEEGELSVVASDKTADQQQDGRERVSESSFGAQGASGSGTASGGDATKRNSSHEFARSREGDSIKGERGRHDRLVRQASTSRENSQKELGGASSKEEQPAIECVPAQQDSYQQAGQPKQQVVEATVPTDRRCRLCWCCCCPCSSSLSNRSQPSRSEAKPSTEPSSLAANRCQTLTNVPLEEIRSWGDSFDRLMKCPDGRKIFQDFLRCEYSEENILFWIACEGLKSERDSKSVATKARDIYEDYISILSAKEVSLDSRVRDVINNNIKKPTSNIFDEAQLQIYTLMHRDSYPRFINSSMYKKLAQIQTTSRKSSS